jgi:NAD(P)H-dependent FMN reductase
MKINVTILSLSLREDSVSSRLAEIAQEHLQKREVNVTYLGKTQLQCVPLFSEENEPSQAMEHISSLLHNSDIVIFSTPVYCTSVSAAAKNILDTFCSELRHKWFAILCSVGSPRAQYAAKDFLTSLIIETQSAAVPNIVCASEEELAQNGQEIAGRIESVCDFLLEGASKLSKPFQRRG